MCGGRSSTLHYGTLIELNNLYAPTPNGQSVQLRRLTKAIYPQAQLALATRFSGLGFNLQL